MKQINEAACRTQKAKSVQVLSSITDYFVPQPIYIIQGDADLPDTLPSDGALTTKWLARPCPLTPRPGFVDSRVVKDARELARVWDETRREEPNGEVLLMPCVRADWNLCLTPGLMSIGPGMDGATAGKDSLALPLVVGLPPQLATAERLTALGILPNAVPHVEVVIGDGHTSNGYPRKGQPFWVQARSGPPAPTGLMADYIPATQECVAVVDVGDDDMLTWEAKVQKFQPGTFAYGKGHTPGSHAALHCLGKQVPFVTTFRPKVGTVYASTPPPEWDLLAIADGIGWGLYSVIDADGSTNNRSHGTRPYVLALLYGLHHAPALQGSAGFWLGAAAAMMMRYGMSAGEGEYGIIGGTQAILPHASPWMGYRTLTGRPYKTFASSREFLPQLIERHFVQFNTSGIGGQNWARCCYSLLALDRAARAVLKADASSDANALVGALIIALNKAVDQAHNGCWWLNKFAVTSQDFAEATAGEWGYVVECAPLLYNVERERGKLLSKRRHRAAARWYAQMPDLQPPAFELNAQVIGGTLSMHWPKSHTGHGKGSGRLVSGVSDGPCIVHRTTHGTAMIVTVERDGKALHSEMFELEIDPRKAAKKAA